MVAMYTHDEAYSLSQRDGYFHRDRSVIPPTSSVDARRATIAESTLLQRNFPTADTSSTLFIPLFNVSFASFCV